MEDQKYLVVSEDSGRLTEYEVADGQVKTSAFTLEDTGNHFVYENFESGEKFSVSSIALFDLVEAAMVYHAHHGNIFSPLTIARITDTWRPLNSTTKTRRSV